MRTLVVTPMHGLCSEGKAAGPQPGPARSRPRTLTFHALGADHSYEDPPCLVLRPRKFPREAKRSEMEAFPSHCCGWFGSWWPRVRGQPWAPMRPLLLRKNHGEGLHLHPGTASSPVQEPGTRAPPALSEPAASGAVTAARADSAQTAWPGAGL